MALHGGQRACCSLSRPNKEKALHGGQGAKSDGGRAPRPLMIVSGAAGAWGLAGVGGGFSGESRRRGCRCGSVVLVGAGVERSGGESRRRGSLGRRSRRRWCRGGRGSRIIGSRDDVSSRAGSLGGRGGHGGSCGSRGRRRGGRDARRGVVDGELVGAGRRRRMRGGR